MVGGKLMLAPYPSTLAILAVMPKSRFDDIFRMHTIRLSHTCSAEHRECYKPWVASPGKIHVYVT